MLVLLMVAGFIGLVMVPSQEKVYYTPGKIPTREDCFYERLALFKNVTRQIIYQVASDCELEVQSLEGHEQMRQEWIERQAQKARQRAAQKAAAEPPPPPPEEPQELDRVRRVWR
ncbi:hypothetical protein [uncultured Ferrovibrio sp.]|uniref:hypothetical protein n=1 Tax=uncultured Ferrovibrio sp. TaxID=1576913 RepID=UPI00263890C8|nr:hypothetical protein [uncultured Ferrovibrio sp.]